MFLNCDETNIPLGRQNSKGVICHSGRSAKRILTSEATQRRGSFTVLGWIASDPELQQFLPQFLVISKKLMSKVSYLELQRATSQPTHVWRLASSWLDSCVFIVMLKILSRVLLRWKDTHLFVIVLDCASIHAHVDVIRSARALGLPLVFIPRHSTWLLQPLDTHVFRKFKATMRRRQSRRQVEGKQLILSVLDVCLAAVETVNEVLVNGKWDTPFWHNGFCAFQASLSARVMIELGISEPPEVPGEMPPHESLLDILPRNKRLPTHLLVAPLPKSRERVPLDPDPGSQNLAAASTLPIGHPIPPRQIESWKDRLRPRTKDGAAIVGSRRFTSRTDLSVTPVPVAQSSTEPWQQPTQKQPS